MVIIEKSILKNYISGWRLNKYTYIGDVRTMLKIILSKTFTIEEHHLRKGKEMICFYLCKCFFIWFFGIWSLDRRVREWDKFVYIQIYDPWISHCSEHVIQTLSFQKKVIKESFNVNVLDKVEFRLKTVSNIS